MRDSSKFFVPVSKPSDEWMNPSVNPSIEKWVEYWLNKRWIIVPSHRRSVRTQIVFVSAKGHTYVDGIELDLFVVPRKQRFFGVRFVSLPPGLGRVNFPLLVFDDLTATTGRWYIGYL